MKIFAVFLLAITLAGCGSRSVVQKWQGSESPLPFYSGAVCLLPGPLPERLEFTFLGRGVANQQQYGGYAKVNAALVEVVRTVGADTVFDFRSKQKIGLFAVVRPQSWGMAARLKNPESFDCAANGGKVYAGNSIVSTARVTTPAGTSGFANKPGSANVYDECMESTLRISDPELMAKAMSACDSVDNTETYKPSSYIAPQNSIYIRSPSSTGSYSSGGSVRVRGYYRKNGTYVRPHTRKRRR